MVGLCLKYMMRNYGSQLQARATIKIIEDLGLEYEILQYNKKGLMFEDLLKYKDEVFYSEHQTIRLTTVAEDKEYQEGNTSGRDTE